MDGGGGGGVGDRQGKGEVWTSKSQRLVDARNAMQTMNLTQLGQPMCESHESMKKYYDVLCKDVDELIDIAMIVEGVFGARMRGGEFGGSIVVLAKPDADKHVISAIDVCLQVIQQIIVPSTNSPSFILLLFCHYKYSDKPRICVLDASFGAKIPPKQKERARSTSKCI
nr:galactokinase 1 [Hymenolepis microstoma]